MKQTKGKFTYIPELPSRMSNRNVVAEETALAKAVREGLVNAVETANVNKHPTRKLRSLRILYIDISLQNTFVQPVAYNQSIRRCLL